MDTDYEVNRLYAGGKINPILNGNRFGTFAVLELPAF